MSLLPARSTASRSQFHSANTQSSIGSGPNSSSAPLSRLPSRGTARSAFSSATLSASGTGSNSGTLTAASSVVSTSRSRWNSAGASESSRGGRSERVHDPFLERGGSGSTTVTTTTTATEPLPVPGISTTRSEKSFDPMALNRTTSIASFRNYYHTSRSSSRLDANETPKIRTVQSTAYRLHYRLDLKIDWSEMIEKELTVVTLPPRKIAADVAMMLKCAESLRFVDYLFWFVVNFFWHAQSHAELNDLFVRLARSYVKMLPTFHECKDPESILYLPYIYSHVISTALYDNCKGSRKLLGLERRSQMTRLIHYLFSGLDLSPAFHQEKKQQLYPEEYMEDLRQLKEESTRDTRPSSAGSKRSDVSERSEASLEMSGSDVSISDSASVSTSTTSRDYTSSPSSSLSTAAAATTRRESNSTRLLQQTVLSTASRTASHAKLRATSRTTTRSSTPTGNQQEAVIMQPLHVKDTSHLKLYFEGPASLNWNATNKNNLQVAPDDEKNINYFRTSPMLKFLFPDGCAKLQTRLGPKEVRRTLPLHLRTGKVKLLPQEKRSIIRLELLRELVGANQGERAIQNYEAKARTLEHEMEDELAELTEQSWELDQLQTTVHKFDEIRIRNFCEEIVEKQNDQIVNATRDVYASVMNMAPKNSPIWKTLSVQASLLRGNTQKDQNNARAIVEGHDLTRSHSDLRSTPRSGDSPLLERSSAATKELDQHAKQKNRRIDRARLLKRVDDELNNARKIASQLDKAHEKLDKETDELNAKNRLKSVVRRLR